MGGIEIPVAEDVDSRKFVAVYRMAERSERTVVGRIPVFFAERFEPYRRRNRIAACFVCFRHDLNIGVVKILPDGNG